MLVMYLRMDLICDCEYFAYLTTSGTEIDMFKEIIGSDMGIVSTTPGKW